MKLLILAIGTIGILSSCGKSSDEASQLETIRLLNENANLSWQLEYDGVFVSRTACASALDCTETLETRLLPATAYDFRLQSQLGVDLVFSGVGGKDGLVKEIANFEAQLADIELRPEAREGLIRELNLLNAQQLEQQDASRFLNEIASAKTSIYLEASDSYFETLSRPFQDLSFPDERRVSHAFVNPASKLVWMPLEVPPANWFDANEVPRQPDLLGGDNQYRERTKVSCKRILGQSWRLPKIAEVKDAISRGLRRHSSYKVTAEYWKDFWTSEEAVESQQTAIYAFSTNFDHTAPMKSSRWEHKKIICVANYDDIKAEQATIYD